MDFPICFPRSTTLFHAVNLIRIANPNLHILREHYPYGLYSSSFLFRSYTTTFLMVHRPASAALGCHHWRGRGAVAWSTPLPTTRPAYPPGKWLGARQ